MIESSRKTFQTTTSLEDLSLVKKVKESTGMPRILLRRISCWITYRLIRRDANPMAIER